MIMKEIASEMRVTPPNDTDINFVLKQIDTPDEDGEEGDGEVDKDEFLTLV